MRRAEGQVDSMQVYSPTLLLPLLFLALTLPVTLLFWGGACDVLWRLSRFMVRFWGCSG